MKATLMLLGACTLAPFAGAFAGASINTTPLEAAGDPLAAVPQHETDFTGDIAYGGMDIPDHYPLVTRHGTIPVAELIFRRFGGSPPWYQADYTPRHSVADEAASSDTGDDSAASSDETPDDGSTQRAADIARLPPIDQAPAPGPALQPADPQLPSTARGMLTAVGQPALPASGANGSLALTQ